MTDPSNCVARSGTRAKDIVKDELFESLLSSVQEGAAILAGNIEPSRRTPVFARVFALFNGNVDAARRWLTTPQPLLGGAIPLEIAKTAEGAREIDSAIGRLEHGVYS